MLAISEVHAADWVRIRILPPPSAMLTVYTLEKGRAYRVIREFRDFYGNVFTPGEQLVFRESQYVPYHGGHTVVFDVRTLYLQDEETVELVDELGRFLQQA